jgi:glycogen(starch) synthase
MRILVVTNLYPPQELGGYGRAMADFVWGLLQRGHQLQVVTSDAPYLGTGGLGPSGERVDRCLQLKGSFEGGVRHLQDPVARDAVDRANASVLSQWFDNGPWDGVLLGNLDLLGPEFLSLVLQPGIFVVHHLGFVAAPFPLKCYPRDPNYCLVSASRAVRYSLISEGFPAERTPVVYPGARVDLFGSQALQRPLPPPPDGTFRQPLRVCFAGLLMSSKGLHTLLEALALLKERGCWVEVMIAGGVFQPTYVAHLKQFLDVRNLSGQVQWLGSLSRRQLARMFRLHHVCVFPSLYPEAFGIVAAEAMASGLALISSGVGGAGELFDHGITGLRFEPGNAESLAHELQVLVEQPQLLRSLQLCGVTRVRESFSVQLAAQQLESLWAKARFGHP